MNSSAEVFSADINGTITGTDASIPPSMIEALVEYQRRGGIVFPNTSYPGFSLDAIKGVWTPNGASILELGGHIIAPDGDTIGYYPFNDSEIASLVEFLETNADQILMSGYVPRGHAGGRIFLHPNLHESKMGSGIRKRISASQFRIESEVNTIIDLIREIERDKSLCMIGMMLKPGAKVVGQENLGMSSEIGGGIVYILPRDNSKAAGLYKACAQLGIDLNGIVILTAGNSPTDLSMLEIPGCEAIVVGSLQVDESKPAKIYRATGPEDVERIIRGRKLGGRR